MIRYPQSFSQRSEAERTHFLQALTFRKSASLLREILRFGARFLKDPQNDPRPLSLDRILHRR